MEPEPTRPANGRQEPASRLLLALDRAVPTLAVAALLLHPTQVTLKQCAQRVACTLGVGQQMVSRLPSVHLTLTDALFACAFLLWVLLNALRRRWPGTIRMIPCAVGALLAAAALSAVPFLKWTPPPGQTFSLSQCLKEFAQLFILFVCTYLVLAEYLRDARWRRKLVVAFVAAAAIAILIGLWEYWRLRPPSPQAAQAGAITSPMRVDATFGFDAETVAGRKASALSNRNVLGAWLTLTLPLIWGIFLYAKGRRGKLITAAIVIAGSVLLLHGGLLAAALLGILAISFARSQRAFLATAAGVFILYGLLFTFGPQRHGEVLLDSVLLYKKVDRFRTLHLYDMPEVYPELHRSDQGAALTGRKDFWPWQQKYVEWQPALVAASKNPFFGVGVGNYQRNIGLFYVRPPGYFNIEKPPSNLMERGGNSFYAVWMVETGFAGLLAFLWLLFEFFRRSAAGHKKARDPLLKGLALGTCGALLALSVGCLFTNYLVRGVGPALIFVLALAAAADADYAEREGQAQCS